MAEPWVTARLPVPTGSKFSPSRWKGLLRDVEARHRLNAVVETDPYAQGFASFVEAWFYRDRAPFRLPLRDDNTIRYRGLAILCCKLGPYVVMGELTRSWSHRSGTSGLPDYDFVDRFTAGDIDALASKCTEALAAEGIMRLGRSDLAPELPSELHIDSNLAGEQQRLFDALFYWYD